MNSFVPYSGSKDVDVSLLLIPLVGFLSADDPRVAGTVASIERELLHDGFVARFQTNQEVDALPPGEGAFLPGTFWLADNYVLLGRHKEAAEQVFERLLGLCNDVGWSRRVGSADSATARQFPPSVHAHRTHQHHREPKPAGRPPGRASHEQPFFLVPRPRQ